MDNKDIFILTQVVMKEFVNTEERLPSNDADSEIIKLAILKTYKSYLLANAKINKLK